MSAFTLPCPSSKLGRGRRWCVVDAKLALSKALTPSQNSIGPRGHLCDALSPAALKAGSWPHPYHRQPAGARASQKLGQECLPFEDFQVKSATDNIFGL